MLASRGPSSLHRNALAALVAALAMLLPLLAAPSSTAAADTDTSSGTAPADTDTSSGTGRVAARTGTLKVRVVKPGGGRRATVIVRGPHGYRKVLRQTTRLKRLTPGRYGISARTVRTKQ